MMKLRRRQWRKIVWTAACVLVIAVMVVGTVSTVFAF